MKIIKCNICKLNIETCNYKCIEIDDVSELYIEGKTEKDAIQKGFCTLHKCSYNPTGLKCELNTCIYKNYY